MGYRAGYFADGVFSSFTKGALALTYWGHRYFRAINSSISSFTYPQITVAYKQASL